MNWFQALVLGAVQGLTEFLPVSSTGHLVIFQAAMQVNTDNVPLFDVLLHMGTLIAVCIFLWDDIVALVKKPIRPLMLYLIIATIPAVLAQLLFGSQIDASLKSMAGMPLGLGFLFTSILMFLTPLFKKNEVDIEKMGVLRPLYIGIAQAIAILPSVSRSGSTIFTGMATGLERKDVARFSFLMSIPAILGGLVVELWKLHGSTSGSLLGSTSILALAAAVVVAAVTGYLALKLVIDTIKSGKLWVFGVYTTVLGLLIIFDSVATHIIFKTAF